MTPTNWLRVAAPAALTHDEVHIWRASQNVEPAALSRLHSLLDSAEKARAERFVFQRDRDRFIVARGILRELLAGYAGSQPTAIEFQYGPQGKPALRTGDSSPARICFNVSHSHGLMVCAFAVKRQLGIDIELIRSDFGGDEIAQRYFSGAEVAELNSLAPEARAEAFFLCWTRKEAYIKARGEGLQLPLGSFSVSLTPGSPEELRAEDSTRWELRSFEPAAGYAGAVVVEGKGPPVRLYDWAP